MSVARTIRGYIWWTYRRGSVHYDIMVTLILAFIFLTPASLFHDKPVSRAPHQTEVAVSSDGANGFVYRVPGSAVQGHDQDEIRQALLRIIEPIAGEVELTRVESVSDKAGHVIEYRAWAARP